MTRGAGNKSDKDEGSDGISAKSLKDGSGSALNTQGIPILAHNRGTSYGSCDEDAPEDSTQNWNQRRHLVKHQIGSDVFDFGDSPLMWPGPLSERLVKKRPSKVSS